MEPDLDPRIVAERIVFQIKRFGKSRFKAIGYKALQNMLKAGAVGAEVVISGRIPGQRHNTWRFSGGRLPKSGYISDNVVDRGFDEVQWNQGTIGIKVALLRADVKNPDHFELVKEEKKIDTKKE
jgi:small subunit ribosomal protein S3